MLIFFADDTKIYNTTENTTVLQDDLQKLYEWYNSLCEWDD